MNNFIKIGLFLILFSSCSDNKNKLFEKLSPEISNVKFANELDESKNISILDYLYYYNGGGVALGDINNDGLVDIYFTSNQGKNKLYLNKGENKFEDISIKAGIEGKSDWQTGTIMADVNGDGYLDIYVCAVVGINGFEGHNELYINNKDNSFTERSSEYGLDIDNYSTSAAFFDYDNDGDLDLYLLNHAIHSETSYGKAETRKNRNYESGDKLFQNNDGHFIDVSEKAGIFGGANGYGLGIAISDFNLDGNPDIYVCNDFHEDDYYYLNNGDGTFSENMKNSFGHISRFSMGVDVADINHDGFPDLMTLDMLPEDEKVLKSSAGDDNPQMLKYRTEKLGYHYQYTRNMLQMNQGGKNFSEIALLSGIAATDWSWSPLFADYDQDGEQDIFICNGIPKRPNDLDYIKYYSNDNIKTKLNTTKLLDKEALKEMPNGNVSNYIFQGGKNLQFNNKSNEWIEKDSIISNGGAYADLDNDGDLDIVTNNLNTIASIYINKTDGKANFLKLKLKFTGKNSFAVGSKVISYVKGRKQFKEIQTSRGFQSSSEPIIHFGYGKIKKVDSIQVIWPDKTYQTLKNIKTNQTLTIQVNKNRKGFNYANLHPKTLTVFKKSETNLGIDFIHQENDFIDVTAQKLIPYQRSDRGPGIVVGDLNNDGKKDIFFGGSQGFQAAIYLQNAKGFSKKNYSSIASDSIYEDASAVIGDFNGDKQNDLIVASGSGQFAANLIDRYYAGNNLDKTFFPETKAMNASVIKALDYDNDGDLDLFIGNNSKSNSFGRMPDCYLFNNNKGVFTITQSKIFSAIGMVTDAVVTDFNNDGFKDLVIVGEWMKPRFFANVKGYFKDVTETLLQGDVNGLWQSICSFDIDQDGDQDYIVGNWGLNSKFKASKEFPMKMYYDDFDKNGTFETIVAIEKNGKYYTTMGLDELVEEFSGLLKKKFNSYKSFAGKTINEIFEEPFLEKAVLYQVHNLKSGYLRNDKGKFTFVPFSNELQVAPITSFVKADFDGDGKDEVFTAGNYFGVTPYHSRFDGFSGALIKSQKKIYLGNQVGIDLSQKAVRHLDIIPFNGKQYLLVTINNNKAEVYELPMNKN